MHKISKESVRKYLKSTQPAASMQRVLDIGEAQIEVTFTPYLDINAQSTLINRVLDGCFDPNGNYRPEYVTPIVNATLLQMCSNLPVLTMPSEREDAGAILDIENMNRVYRALRLEDDPDYCSFYYDLLSLAESAVKWKCDRLNSERVTVQDEVLTKIGDAFSTVQTFLETLGGMIEDGSLDKLGENAQHIADAIKANSDGVFGVLTDIESVDSTTN